MNKLKEFGNKINQKNNINYYNNFIMKNIKKGIGVGIGNILRRIILKYTEGYGITCFFINEIQHEFSSIFGLYEDIQQLLINFSKVIFKGEKIYETCKVIINKKGIITASSIETNLTVVNPDQYLCTLNEDIQLNIKFNVEKNNGSLILSNLNSKINSIIPSTVLFCPIINVNYEIIESEYNNAYEDIKFFIHTNGSISPKDVWEFANTFLLEQLTKEQSDIEQSNIVLGKKDNSISLAIFNKRITDITDNEKILQCLSKLSIEYIGELVQITEEELMQQPKIGKKSINNLIEDLKGVGLTLGMEIEWSKESFKASAIKSNVKNDDFLIG